MANRPRGPADLIYSGGFCPVAITQHCTGLMTKADAAALCSTTGGRLCYNAAEAALISGAKTGCSYDGWPVWTADMPDSNPNAFPRCKRSPDIAQDFAADALFLCQAVRTTRSPLTAPRTRRST